eukprot:TRINITY_DN5755_c0_g1_i4.p1 TRINITY_DN5755_c0_g1~~TRINITY_DN5755_c0_g1_i4.p1  ORF type:complete len:621 (+),score=141.25 TRINITY_DN5755_c0_g1_i4:949-2811(+)
MEMGATARARQASTNGDDCAKQCTEAVDCSGNAVSVAVNGNGDGCDCTCSPGFYEDDCAKQCTEAVDCNGNAASVAVNAGGTGCDCTCSPGWAAPDCSACEVSFYGPTCGSQCTPMDCSGNAAFVSVNGTGDGCDCTCMPGWAPPTCAACKVNFYGPTCGSECTIAGACSGNADSVAVNGTGDGCDCTCSPGWAGPACDVCDTNFYGPACASECTIAGHCSGNADAVVVNAAGNGCDCTCSAGWLPPACDATPEPPTPAPPTPVPEGETVIMCFNPSPNECPVTNAQSHGRAFCDFTDEYAARVETAFGADFTLGNPSAVPGGTLSTGFGRCTYGDDCNDDGSCALAVTFRGSALVADVDQLDRLHLCAEQPRECHKLEGLGLKPRRSGDGSGDWPRKVAGGGAEEGDEGFWTWSGGLLMVLMVVLLACSSIAAAVFMYTQRGQRQFDPTMGELAGLDERSISHLVPGSMVELEGCDPPRDASIAHLTATSPPSSPMAGRREDARDETMGLTSSDNVHAFAPIATTRVMSSALSSHSGSPRGVSAHVSPACTRQMQHSYGNQSMDALLRAGGSVSPAAQNGSMSTWRGSKREPSSTPTGKAPSPPKPRGGKSTRSVITDA